MMSLGAGARLAGALLLIGLIWLAAGWALA